MQGVYSKGNYYHERSPVCNLLADKELLGWNVACFDFGGALRDLFLFAGAVFVEKQGLNENGVYYVEAGNNAETHIFFILVEDNVSAVVSMYESRLYTVKHETDALKSLLEESGSYETFYEIFGIRGIHDPAHYTEVTYDYQWNQPVVLNNRVVADFYATKIVPFFAGRVEEDFLLKKIDLLRFLA